MDTKERTDEETRTGERLGEAAMQTFSPYLPEAAEKARVGSNVSRMVNHEWLSKSAKRGTLEAVMAAKAAHELGFKNQVKHHLLKAEDRFLFDVSNKAVILAGEHGCDLRPLAKLGKIPEKRFEIRGVPIHGRNVRWRFVDIESYEGAIPGEILMNAKAIKELGIEWDRVFVAEPIIEIPVVRTAARVDNDPILAASRGRYLWEIGRWL